MLKKLFAIFLLTAASVPMSAVARTLVFEKLVIADERTHMSIEDHFVFTDTKRNLKAEIESDTIGLDRIELKVNGRTVLLGTSFSGIPLATWASEFASAGDNRIVLGISVSKGRSIKLSIYQE